MSGAISRVSASPTPAAGATQAPDAHTEKLRKAAGDFESLLIKQLLKESKIAGSEKGNGYGDMAIDALASAVERGGGLGLAKHIEHAIHGQAQGHAPASSGAAGAAALQLPTTPLAAPPAAVPPRADPRATPPKEER